MLVATDATGTHRVASSGAAGTAFCPRCGNMLVHRAPRRASAHYAHRPGQACTDGSTRVRLGRATSARSAQLTLDGSLLPTTRSRPRFAVRDADAGDPATEATLF